MIRPVTDYLLAAAPLFALLLLGYASMWWGWRNRRRRQLRAGHPLPAPPPADLAGLRTDPEPIEGNYLGTTTAGDWLDRVVVHGLGTRSRVLVTASEHGWTLDREGADSFHIPADAIRAVRRDRAIAGKVARGQRIVVVTWRHGEQLLDTGVRPRAPEHVDELISATPVPRTAAQDQETA